MAAYGRIDILINNAALFADLDLKPTEEIPVEEWDQLMGVNLRVTFLACKAVLPAMKAQSAGKTVNITSNTVFSGAPLMAQYVASKAGIIGFTRSLAREAGRHGICVNALAPGLTDTEGARNLMPDERFQAVTTLRALPRRQTPGDLVGTLLFLSSEESGFITGQALNVDGGQIMY
jgi:NAD(P)-dependent dehydrogenase (short-subunit alcohol dehydrogenase family)